MMPNTKKLVGIMSKCKKFDKGSMKIKDEFYLSFEGIFSNVGKILNFKR